MLEDRPCGDTERRQPSEAKRRALRRDQPCRLFHLRLVASRTVKKLIFIVKSPSLWYFVMVTLADEDIFYYLNAKCYIAPTPTPGHGTDLALKTDFGGEKSLYISITVYIIF